MAYLLDTQILIWILGDPKKLSQKATDLIKDKKNSLLVSKASFWEIVIKVGLGKLQLPINLHQLVQETHSNNISIIEIEIAAIINLSTLPHHHRDPFDWLIISHGIVKDIAIISNDRKFSPYDVNVIW